MASQETKISEKEMEGSPSSVLSTLKQTRHNYCSESESESESETQLLLFSPHETSTWPRKPHSVMLEGHMNRCDSSDEGSVGRSKSLMDDDLEDLKGCLDLGFGFSYEEIPKLCNTLPALELCYSMSQKFQENDSLSVANWRISLPGDDPEEVKARLRYWAQAVACTVRLCS